MPKSSYIGEYIHAHSENYRDFGINRTKGTNDVSSALVRQRRRLRMIVHNAGYTGQQLQDLSEYYTNLFYGDTLGQQLYIESSDEIVLQTLLDTITNIVDESTGNDWTSEQVSKSLTQRSDAILQNTSFASKNIDQYLEVGTITKLLNTLEKAYNKAGQVGNRYQGKIPIRDATLSVNQLKNIINQIKAQLERSIDGLQRAYKGELKGTERIYFNSGWFSPIKGNSSIGKNFKGQITDYKELMKLTQDLLRLYQGSGVFRIAGTSSEVATVVDVVYQNAGKSLVDKNANNLIKILTKNRINSQVNKMWRGNKNTVQNFSNKLSYSMLIEDDLLGENGLGKDNNFGSYSRTGRDWQVTYKADNGNTLQGTIDVALTPDIDTKLGKIVDIVNKTNNTIYMSQKNYSSIKNGVSLLDGTPLTNLLMTDFFDPWFVNHYLNLICFHKDFESEYQEAISYVQWGATLRGFTGFYRDNEVLMINDKSSKTVYFESSYNFNQKIAENYRNIKKIANVTMEPSPSSAKKANTYLPFKGAEQDWEEAGKRITKYFIALHQVKIFVSLKKTAITGKNGIWEGMNSSTWK